jgi:hypothetical protein
MGSDWSQIFPAPERRESPPNNAVLMPPTSWMS